MTDGWDHDPHHDDDPGHPLADDLAVPGHHHDQWEPDVEPPGDDPDWEPPAAEAHDPPAWQPPDTAPGEPAETPGPGAAPEPAAEADVFPPALDVGPLPEPVDGFPWIDTGSLGAADIAADIAAAAPAGDLTAAELAAHAATDLPPGADPWAALETSDDPATAALARFYRPGTGA